MSDELATKIDIIYFKGTLIELPTAELQEAFSKKEDYRMFLQALNSTLKQEPAFFLLSDKLIKRAEDILYEHRFTYKDEEIINLINEIIIGFNRLNNMDDKTKKDSLKVYEEEQSQKRGIFIRNRDELIFMTSHDTSVMHAMMVGKSVRWESYYFIGSTNYLVNTIPEFYIEYQALTQQTIKNLEKITSNNSFPNLLIKPSAEKSIKNIQKIKIKEE